MALQIDGTLLLAGAGNMGDAMLAGWLDRGLDPARIIVQDPAPSPRVKDVLAKHGIIVQATVGSLPAPPAVIVVAVKPQVMDEVFPPLGRLAGKSTVVLSIAAGRTIAGFEKHLPKGTAVVRSMPNTPASMGAALPWRCRTPTSHRRSGPPATPCCAPSARWPGSTTRA